MTRAKRPGAARRLSEAPPAVWLVRTSNGYGVLVFMSLPAAREYAAGAGCIFGPYVLRGES